MPRTPRWPPPIYRNPSTGQARIRVKGRDIYLGRHGSPEARQAYLRVVAEIEAGKTPVARSTAKPGTVADVVASWISEESGRYTARGRELARFHEALQPLLALYSLTPAASFDADALDVLRSAMASGSWMNAGEKAKREKHGQPIGWCRNVINRHVVRIRTVWRWAERKKLVPAGSWAHLCSLKGLASNDARVRQTAPVQSAVWSEVLAVCKKVNERVRTMLLLQWWTGMRSAEVRLLRSCDIDRTGDIWVYRPCQHKNDWRGQERLIPLGRKAQALLRRWLDGLPPDAFVFRPKPDPQKPYSTFSYAQAIRRAAERAGCPGFHPYQTRHACKDRITREAGLDAARSVLGQRSIGTTNGYGTQADLKTAIDVARRLG